MGFDWIAPKNYKRHFICLPCQKGFKRSSEKDMINDTSIDIPTLLEKYYQTEEKMDILRFIMNALDKAKVACPNCRGEMVLVHYNFEVPPFRDKKAWQTLRDQYSTKTHAPLTPYIHWHRQALQEANLSTDKHNKIKQNLLALERAAGR